MNYSEEEGVETDPFKMSFPEEPPGGASESALGEENVGKDFLRKQSGGANEQQRLLPGGGSDQKIAANPKLRGDRPDEPEELDR